MDMDQLLLEPQLLSQVVRANFEQVALPTGTAECCACVAEVKNFLVGMGHGGSSVWHYVNEAAKCN